MTPDNGDTDRLFAVYLGGKASGATIETHDLVFVTGVNVRATFPKLVDLWYGEKFSLHVDAWADLTLVDRYQVVLSKKDSPKKTEPKLFFTNVGFYRQGLFGEQHHFHFFVSESKAHAKARAKEHFAADALKPHVDNVAAIDRVDGYRVCLEASATVGQPKFENVYWPIRLSPSLNETV